MASERVGDMTKAELEAFVLEIIARHYPQYAYVQKSTRPPEELWQSILDNTVDIKPEEPSTSELLGRE